LRRPSNPGAAYKNCAHWSFTAVSAHLWIINYEWCPPLGFRCAHLEGSMADERRRAQLESFQNNPAVQVMVLTIRAGCVGAYSTKQKKNIYCR
jgi:hypothetical protein